ncbi:hypothetical protein NC653_033428 [Populus alba x Populus x berolinensis]|uniref:Uncharacterized protein n=1 Tax=Populus alba x Populus x berolinensis TaxID=444605 RepID=A0AAD6PZ34_9ROSI|nr:hypothetical protein NC653_033428 [Populus alba x Populus x berolinensis]
MLAELYFQHHQLPPCPPLLLPYLQMTIATTGMATDTGTGMATDTGTGIGPEAATGIATED